MRREIPEWLKKAGKSHVHVHFNFRVKFHIHCNSNSHADFRLHRHSRPEIVPDRENIVLVSLYEDAFTLESGRSTCRSFTRSSPPIGEGSSSTLNESPQS